MQHLPGIRSQALQTARLRSHYLSSGDASGEAVVLLHGNLSASTFFELLMLGLPASYQCIAPDMRGFGDSQALPIDARRGMQDLSDDLLELLEALKLEQVHLLGWSAGAGVAMDFTLRHPRRVRSLSLVAPVSPYGFGGTADIDGTPLFADYAASGAGIVGQPLIEQMRKGNQGLSSPFGVRRILREFLVCPGTDIEREDELVNAMLKQKLGERFYPGDHQPSQNFSAVKPGNWGLMNALSPKHFNLSGLANLRQGPPVLWLRGENDQVISDHSAFDLATLQAHRQDMLAESAQDSSAPGTAQAPSTISPQPMVGQTRRVLQAYQQRAGSVEEHVFAHTGHSPFLEQPTAFLEQLSRFLEASRPGKDRH